MELRVKLDLLKKKEKVFKTLGFPSISKTLSLAGAEGKRGENSRTVFGDAPEENKEKIKRVYRSEDLRLYFRAVGEPKVRVHFTPAIFRRKNKSRSKKTSAFWQGRKDSNPRPMVLETSTLPTELHPYCAVY